MTDSPLAPRPMPYRFAGVVSLLLHALLVGGIVVTSMLHTCGPAIDLSKTPVAAHLVRLGTPRDPKLLPRMPTEPPPPPPQPKVAPEPVAAPTPTPKAAPTPTPTAVAAAPKAAKPDTTKKLDDILKHYSNAAPGKAEPVIGMADGDKEGDADTAAEGDRYLALVKKRVHDAFQLPSTLSDDERVRLMAVAIIYIDANGRIVRFNVTRGTSNPQFDAAVEAAIARASPVPPPPPAVRSMAAGGVEVHFRPLQ